MKENNYKGVLQTNAFTTEMKNVVLQKQLNMAYDHIGHRDKRVRGFRGCALKAKQSNKLLGNI